MKSFSKLDGAQLQLRSSTDSIQVIPTNKKQKALWIEEQLEIVRQKKLMLKEQMAKKGIVVFVDRKGNNNNSNNKSTSSINSINSTSTNQERVGVKNSNTGDSSRVHDYNNSSFTSANSNANSNASLAREITFEHDSNDVFDGTASTSSKSSKALKIGRRSAQDSLPPEATPHLVELMHSFRRERSRSRQQQQRAASTAAAGAVGTATGDGIRVENNSGDAMIGNVSAADGFKGVADSKSDVPYASSSSSSSQSSSSSADAAAPAVVSVAPVSAPIQRPRLRLIRSADPSGHPHYYDPLAAVTHAHSSTSTSVSSQDADDSHRGISRSTISASTNSLPTTLANDSIDVGVGVGVGGVGQYEPSVSSNGNGNAHGQGGGNIANSNCNVNPSMISTNYVDDSFQSLFAPAYSFAQVTGQPSSRTLKGNTPIYVGGGGGVRDLSDVETLTKALALEQVNAVISPRPVAQLPRHVLSRGTVDEFIIKP
jgi:hypothetical protein